MMSELYGFMGLPCGATISLPGFYEPVSSLTHLFAAPVFLLLGIRLIMRGRGCRGRMISLGVLVFTTAFLLSISGVYHLLAPGTGRYVLKILDVSGVFVLIAGTATPIHYILFRDKLRWGPIFAFWTVAAAGIALRATFPDTLPPGLGIGIFLAMGWAGAVSLWLLWQKFGYEFVRPLLLGGLAYSAGAIMLGLGWPEVVPGAFGPHELWHLAVLVGLSQHWRFVFRFADGSYHFDAAPDTSSQQPPSQTAAFP